MHPHPITHSNVTPVEVPVLDQSRSVQDLGAGGVALSAAEDPELMAWVGRGNEQWDR